MYLWNGVFDRVFGMELHLENGEKILTTWKKADIQALSVYVLAAMYFSDRRIDILHKL